jgi:hypothetical protein
MIAAAAPEGDTHVVMLDEKAPDAATAVSQAWAAYKPGFAKPLRQSVNGPDHDGWTGGCGKPSAQGLSARIFRRPHPVAAQ